MSREWIGVFRRASKVALLLSEVAESGKRGVKKGSPALGSYVVLLQFCAPCEPSARLTRRLKEESETEAG